MSWSAEVWTAEFKNQPRPRHQLTYIMNLNSYVQHHKGHTPIHLILIANNGMAAVKVMRSIRKWSYDVFASTSVIKFVAMVTKEDLEANAEYVRMSDFVVEVEGGESYRNYNNIDLIVDIAVRYQVDAVWVGWGYSSENPVLQERLPPGIVFIGPRASAMRVLGDKIGSTILAQSVGIPCIDWSGQGLKLDIPEQSQTNREIITSIPSDLYAKASIHTVEEGLEHALRIGFPVMIKASEGGGGKGIRIVSIESAFKSAFSQVQREVQGSPIFIMKVVTGARHLEVQVVMDEYGEGITVFGRDCSVQRRHQKIIEEAPVTIAGEDIRAMMERDAMRLAKLVGYKSMGTVEYLYEVDTQKYYFLELNPRLQVEHPITEMVSGVDLVVTQLLIAMGLPLCRIKDIRLLYGLSPNGKSEIDFTFHKLVPKGFVISVRLTAENAEDGFRPTGGKVLELNFKSNSNVWAYFSVNGNGGIHSYADSQFGHLFSYGFSREEARKRLVVTLEEMVVRGEFRTTIKYLIGLLESKVFVDNELTTGWLDGLIQNTKEVGGVDEEKVVIAMCGAVALARLQVLENKDKFKQDVEMGREASSNSLKMEHSIEFLLQNIKFSLTVFVKGENWFGIRNGLGSEVEVEVKELTNEGILMLFGLSKRVIYLKRYESYSTIMVDGATYTLQKDDDPSCIASPSTGKLIRYLVQDGDAIQKGTVVVEIEVMKMVMEVKCGCEGIFYRRNREGGYLKQGELIGKIEGSTRKSQKVFEGPLKENASDGVEKANARLKRLTTTVLDIMRGYDPRSTTTLFSDFIACLEDPIVGKQDFLEALGGLRGRISPMLFESLSNIGLDYELVQTLLKSKQSMAEREQSRLVLEPLLAIIEKYRNGVPSVQVMVSILDEFCSIMQSKSMLEMKRDGLAIERIIEVERSRNGGPLRHELILKVVEWIALNGGKEGRKALARVVRTGIKSRIISRVKVLLDRQIHVNLEKLKGLGVDLNRIDSYECNVMDSLRDLLLDQKAEIRGLGLYLYWKRNRKDQAVINVPIFEGNILRTESELFAIGGEVLDKCNHLTIFLSDGGKSWLEEHKGELEEKEIQYVTVVVLLPLKTRFYYYHLRDQKYEEIRMIRGIEPVVVKCLERERLEEFDLRTLSDRVFYCVGKRDGEDKRLIGLSALFVTTKSPVRFQIEEELTKVMNEFEDLNMKTDCNHITVLVDTKSLTEGIEEVIKGLRSRLFQLHVTHVEIITVEERLIVDIRSEFSIDFAKQSVTSVVTERSKDSQMKFGLRESIRSKRNFAHLVGTTYVYDLPLLFKEGLKGSHLEYSEYILQNDCLVETSREQGKNDCGVVVFLLKLEKSEVILIANDITFYSGSFGPLEDRVFLRASELARKRKIPRIYISSNSGARVGLADEVVDKVRVKWNNNEEQDGVEYLYLTAEDYLNLEKYVVATLTSDCTYQLNAIIGKQHGIGVENLQGSGEIASETSKAYSDVFTISMVTGRSVGIGAYLVRLGRRIVQVEGSSILLTGAGALNKVLGKEVYKSNLQLGGVGVMSSNGVTGRVAKDDYEGVLEVLKWLNYYLDKVELKGDQRPISAFPQTLYDPRVLLDGDNAFFDRGSFTEYYQEYSKGVVVGRARLFGISMGVISVETRTTESFLDSDPAVETSREEVVQEAAGVFYPSSSFKTAQAIDEFDKEGLPLIIMANWRGFSGGQKDMCKEVLKFGAMIVEALRIYKQPIFVYIIGELRGGAWVVLDPSINKHMMEMYCYEDARGGVLEPEGIVEIKFRKARVIKTIKRLDEAYRSLKDKFDSTTDEIELASLQERMNNREEALIGIYEGVGVQLADLHDKPERMVAKNVVKRVVEWTSSRSFFGTRLKRRLREVAMCKTLTEKAGLHADEGMIALSSWYGVVSNAACSTEEAVRNDEKFISWFDSTDHSTAIQNLQNNHIKDRLLALGSISKIAFIDAYNAMLTGFTDEDRKLIRTIK